MLLVEYELSDGFVFLNERMVCPIVKDTGEGMRSGGTRSFLLLSNHARDVKVAASCCPCGSSVSVEVLLDFVYTLHRIASLSCLKISRCRRPIPGQACLTRCFDPSPLIYVLDGHRDQSQSTLNQPFPPSQPFLQNQPFPPFQGVGCGDSSRPFYAMYCKIADEESKRMASQIQKYLDGTLIFVSTYVSPIDSAHQPKL